MTLLSLKLVVVVLRIRALPSTPTIQVGGRYHPLRQAKNITEAFQTTPVHNEGILTLDRGTHGFGGMSNVWKNGVELVAFEMMVMTCPSWPSDADFWNVFAQRSLPSSSGAGFLPNQHLRHRKTTSVTGEFALCVLRSSRRG
ncbi:hypothetical protein PAXINDRAFT_13338 [Paxillus involutus ATCC 200175]|uniref:Uncharacterized protein n=1 Tax=Paxillus involutus ATCC 200175 TaxID=664439 RepID=A0A0C9TDW9_PAXIN|nr:hypothetical protein PAXINDRAFT_13338 [Paxillus involutus ATCC 200175]